MLSRILGNHSAVLTLNELHYFGDLCHPATGSEPLETARLVRLSAVLLARQARGLWGAGPTSAERAQATAVCKDLQAGERCPYGVFAAVLSRFAGQANKTIICEQTPRNIFYAGRILEAFPQARILHIVRDPRAVLASQKNRWQLRRLGAENVPYAELVRTWLNYHPITMAKLWADATRSALRLAGNPRVRIVGFEGLVERPAEVIGEICEFLGIDFEPDMLLVPQWGSSNIRHEMTEKGISKEVVARWQTVLRAGEASIAEYFAGDLMKRFSYTATHARSALANLSLIRYVLSYPFHLLGVALANPRRAWIQMTAVLQSSERG